MKRVESAEREESMALQPAVDEICRRFRLAELYVFGSRAREIAARVRGTVASADADTDSARRRREATDPNSTAADRRLPASDVDVGVRPLPGVLLDVHALVDLADKLERCFDVPRVDVVLLPTAKAFLALDVIRGELLYCADPDAQAEYELYVLRRAGDLLPFQRFREKLALSRYERG